MSSARRRNELLQPLKLARQLLVTRLVADLCVTVDNVANRIVVTLRTGDLGFTNLQSASIQKNGLTRLRHDAAWKT